MARDERMVTVPHGGLDGDLEAVYLAPAPGETRGAVVAPPHPLYGGSLESPVVSELAFAFARAGLAALKFNWRGIGASAGRASGEPDAAEADYAAALEHLAETVAGGLVAGGYSFGAVAALRAGAAASRVERVVLVSPPPAMLEAGSLRSLGRPLLVVTGGADEIAPPAGLERLLDGAPAARFEVIDDADHFFMTGLAPLARLVTDWLG